MYAYLLVYELQENIRSASFDLIISSWTNIDDYNNKVPLLVPMEFSVGSGYGKLFENGLYNYYKVVMSYNDHT